MTHFNDTLQSYNNLIVELLSVYSVVHNFCSSITSRWVHLPELVIRFSIQCVNEAQHNNTHMLAFVVVHIFSDIYNECYFYRHYYSLHCMRLPNLRINYDVFYYTSNMKSLCTRSLCKVCHGAGSNLQFI